jgi:hypothetical protein
MDTTRISLIAKHCWRRKTRKRSKRKKNPVTDSAATTVHRDAAGLSASGAP